MTIVPGSGEANLLRRDMQVHLFARIAAVIRRVIGVPDYEYYLLHVRRCHPNVQPMSRDVFVAEALVQRYQRPGNRCC